MLPGSNILQIGGKPYLSGVRKGCPSFGNNRQGDKVDHISDFGNSRKLAIKAKYFHAGNGFPLVSGPANGVTTSPST